jgi:hypothetical protein
MTVTMYVGPPGSRLDVPPNCGTMWIEGETIHLRLPAVEDIQATGRTPMRIASHVLRCPADTNGIASVEMVLHLRREMMKAKNRGVLLAFAEVGDDLPAIFQLYKRILP